jgi:hypothetical protein
VRRSTGGCYDIDGTRITPVTLCPTDTVSLAQWRERQADLWAESASVAHLHHHLTAEESGLWHAMWAELQDVNAAILRLEGDASGGS